MGRRFGPRGYTLVLAAALLSATGCTYLGNRKRDALEMFDIGLTFSKKPQFGLYANCPFLAPGGYVKLEGSYVGLGGGKFGVMDVRQDAAAAIFWGREDIEWKKGGGEDGEGKSTGTGGTVKVGPLGVGTDAQGNPAYKPQCAHYFHLGFIGITGNLNYDEWADFFTGWVGIDLRGDDKRADDVPPEERFRDISARLCRPRDGLLLFARTDKEVYRPDEPIILDVQLWNRTGTTRQRGDKSRDLSVYFEPFAQAPNGKPAEWLFKFHVFNIQDSEPCYKSPQFEVPPDKRGDYYHAVTLPPGACIGRRFVFPPANNRKWLKDGHHFFLLSYEVGDDYPYVILNPQFTALQAKALGPDLAYTKVWTGKLFSNIALFRIRSPKRFLGIF